MKKTIIFFQYYNAVCGWSRLPCYKIVMIKRFEFVEKQKVKWITITGSYNRPT